MTLRPEIPPAEAGPTSHATPSPDSGTAPAPGLGRGTTSTGLPPNRTPLIPRPVKPRPSLFALFCVVFAIWIGVLVWIYATLVYPVRHHPGAGPTMTGPLPADPSFTHSPRIEPMQPQTP